MKTFLEFIDSDIEAKKTLITSLPTKTKTNKKKYNQKIDEINSKYLEYQAHLRKYLDAKSNKFEAKRKTVNSEKIYEELKTLENVKFALNPVNTFYEKMRFDNLIYEISNYTDFKFKSLNNIIKEFLSLFAQIGIKLTKEDFKYTFYVYEYMKVFLEENEKEKVNQDVLNKAFEKIYWLNPKVVEHIELNFRKLIKQNKKSFETYVSNKELELKKQYSVLDYQECLTRLKETYINLKELEQENIWDLVDMAKEGSLDINMFFDDSKLKTTAFSSLTIDALKLDDEKILKKFYETLKKLRYNLVEYQNYVEFKPLIDYFVKEYSALLTKPKDKKSINVYNQNIRKIEKEIKGLESKLEKTNKEIFDKSKLKETAKNNYIIKQLKIDSTKLAEKLYELYKKQDEEEFNLKIFTMINKSLTVSELMHFYYSHDYYKKQTIKKIMDLETYQELLDISDKFDLFAMNPTNIITKGSLVMDPIELDTVIVNKYRLDNINIVVDNLDEGEIGQLLDKIELLLRVKIIDESDLSVQELWFMSEVSKIKRKELET